MKCRLKPFENQENQFALEFDRVIPPVFRQSSTIPSHCWMIENRQILFRMSSRGMRYFARLAARLNAGKIPLELVRPARTYLSVLEGLGRVDGLIDVSDGDPYGFYIKVAGMFEPVEVASRVARILQQCFYPDEVLEWGEGFDRSAGETTTPGFDAEQPPGRVVFPLVEGPKAPGQP